MAGYEQLPLWGEDYNPEQMSLPLAFEASLPDPHGSAPIAAEGGDYDMIDIREEDDTTPDKPVGQAAIMTVIPTSTTNPQRPRTLAAGYDHHRKTISVVFRDGTIWNYYGCSIQMWNAFKRAPSKGVYIRTRLDPMGDYGPAENNGQTTLPENLRRFASTLQSSGGSRGRIGYQFHDKQFKGGFNLMPKAPKPTYSQRRYREEIRRIMDSGSSATEAVMQARRNLERRTR